MPLTLNKRQKEALEALRWLYSESESHRRTGRSSVLAISYLYRAIEARGNGRYNRYTWVPIEDHVRPSVDANRLTAQLTQRLVCELGLSNYFQFDRLDSRVFIRFSGYHVDHTYQTLQRSFGSLSETLSAGVLNSIQGSSESSFPVLPQTTVWDLITDDD